MDEIIAACPQCRKQLLIKTNFAGQNICCPGCNQVFQVNLPPPPPPGTMNTPAFSPEIQNPPQDKAERGQNFQSWNFVFPAITALALAVAVFSFFGNKEPELKFSKDPEEAAAYYLRYWVESIKHSSEMDDMAYYIKKHGNEYCRNMEIVEVRSNRNYEHVFCKTYVNDKERRFCYLFRKNSDGYLIKSNFKEAGKDISKYWCDNEKSRKERFVRNHKVKWADDI